MQDLILEHSGTEEHNRLALDIKEMLEEQFDYTVKEIISVNKEQVTLYTKENLMLIGDFSSMPNKEDLRLYLSLMT